MNKYTYITKGTRLTSNQSVFIFVLVEEVELSWITVGSKKDYLQNFLLFTCKYSIIRAFCCDSESRYDGIEAVYDIQYLFVDST